MKFYALSKGIILGSMIQILDRYFEYATIEPAKTTRPVPQGHGGF